MRVLPFLFYVTFLQPAVAQDFGCPTNVNQQIHDMTAKARAGGATMAELAESATAIVRGCGRDRVILAQFFEMFTVAGLAIEPPDADRFSAHLNAFRTIDGINQAGGDDFEPLILEGPDGANVEWSVIDERNAYWDLIYAMASDFLVYGVHADIYTPGRTEQIGCGLYPAEEVSALAAYGQDNVDGGELLARVTFLGRSCDTPGRETSGYAAQYFAGHLRARRDNEDYVGLTESDIRWGLQTFLEMHLDGAPQSGLFGADEAKELLEF